MKENPNREITVIYDGECNFCIQAVNWLQQKLVVTAIPYQSPNLSDYQVTYERCRKEVIVISDGITYGGADAVTFLLRARGNRNIAVLLRLSGPISHFGYRWIASHRDSFLVKLISVILKRLVK
jgi:predicted DCC family thiol-disulfide oxidoreductase YuxK